MKIIYTAKLPIDHNGTAIPAGGQFALDPDVEADADAIEALQAVNAIDDGVEATPEALAALAPKAKVPKPRKPAPAPIPAPAPTA